jgi:hypothetical protein
MRDVCLRHSAGDGRWLMLYEPVLSFSAEYAGIKLASEGPNRRKLSSALTRIFPVRVESETLANKLWADSRCDRAEGASAICDFTAMDPSTI